MRACSAWSAFELSPEGPSVIGSTRLSPATRRPADDGRHVERGHESQSCAVGVPPNDRPGRREHDPRRERGRAATAHLTQLAAAPPGRPGGRRSRPLDRQRRCHLGNGPARTRSAGRSPNRRPHRRAPRSRKSRQGEPLVESAVPRATRRASANEFGDTRARPAPTAVAAVAFGVRGGCLERLHVEACAPPRQGRLRVPESPPCIGIIGHLCVRYRLIEGYKSSRPTTGEAPRYRNSITLRIPSWASISSKPRLTSSRPMRWETKGVRSISPAR
jgi:hypothetical protein